MFCGTIMKKILILINESYDLIINQKVAVISQRIVLWTLYCAVPENIHTPTTEGLENSEGEGQSKTQEIPKGRGVVWSIYFPEVPWFNTDLSVDLAVHKSFLTY